MNGIKMIRSLKILFAVCSFISALYAQDQENEDQLFNTTLIKQDSIIPHPSNIETAIIEQFTDCEGNFPEGTELNTLGYPVNFMPAYDESIIKARLNELNTNSEIAFDYNDATLAYVKLFSNNRREMMSRMMGLAELYFPLFEEKLAEYDLPKELKYLAIIESALNPMAKSRSGAVGLWQFMPPTGKLFGLAVNNEVDERRDPYEATIAACKYLKELYGYFGDWHLALSAYNAGPGTLRKAIKKSGGITNYWKLRPYLPKETQGYVPAFTGAAYVMNFGREHNICATDARFEFHDLIRVDVTNDFTFNHLAEILDISADDLKYLNPAYKNELVTIKTNPHTIYLPKDKLSDFAYCEQDIYNMYLCSIEPEYPSESELAETLLEKTQLRTHVVKSGESLGLIAKKYNCSVSELMAWNELNKLTIYPGQKLSVHTVDVAQLLAKSAEALNQENEKNLESSQKLENKPQFLYYTVQKGDTLWDIANLKGVTVQHLKQLNNINNEKSLMPGTRIKVSQIG
jgi:membrane-bound lytic murein transglycosylase D